MITLFIFELLGPDLPTALYGITASTVPLGNGQAIFGGIHDISAQYTIYHMTCASGDCNILKLYEQLSVPRGFFVVIPVPDFVSGCGAEVKYLLSDLLSS